MAVSIEEIKRLKNLTGVGLTDAKKALTEADGDFDKALDAMRKKGLTRAEKKGEREARQGIVDSYVHESRIGVLIELNCETDFVARTDDFKTLAHDIAMHIAASSPEYVSNDEIPSSDREEKAKEFKDKVVAEGKPAEMADKIIEGMLNKYFSERCLLDQAYIKNPDQTVGDLVKEHVAKLGENIVVRKMARVEIGQVN
ncbi:MAG TPA: translation elongation factor Ts [Candidatus Saccharibacteria bacterium]|jgi:elongation factor Ts|nr:translation elongation factor Ts [Candidatus Saccharibacteria bacterium]